MKKMHGKEHADTLMIMGGLASMLKYRGKYQEL